MSNMIKPRKIIQEDNRTIRMILATQEARRSMVKRASQMAEKIKKDKGLRWSEFSDTPLGIPNTKWDLPQEWMIPDGEKEWMKAAGSIGEYFSEKFYDSTLPEAFNTGFYTAMLAVKEGLVDPEVFVTDKDYKETLALNLVMLLKSGWANQYTY
jgi:hypothetical protein